MKKSSLFLAIISALVLSVNLALALDLSQIADTARNALESGNEFCLSAEPVITAIFGTECTNDLTFILTMTLWIVFLMLFFDGIASFTPFSKRASFFIALAFVIVLANLGHFFNVSQFIISLVSTPTGLAITAISLILFLLFYLIFRDSIIKGREKIKKARLEQGEKNIMQTGEIISKALRE